MLTTDEFVEKANNAASAEDLASLFVRDMRDEGYDNVSFRRVKAGQLLLIQCASLPISFMEAYYANGFMADDPFVAAALASPRKFRWADLEAAEILSERQRNVLQAFRDLGVHSGMSFPFHGPDGACDLIGISQRTLDPVDPSRTEGIEEKLKYTRWRYWELRQQHSGAGRELPQCNSWVSHARGPREMTSHHCRALVYVSVAAQRWESGLTRFNRRLLDYVSPNDVEFLLRWGLIHEVPDEAYFYYYFAPTVLGSYHLRSCRHVAEFRRQVWEMEVGGHASITRIERQ